MALANPALSVSAQDLVPERRGLASSLIGFMQMIVFATVAGFVAPLLYDSALGLACGALVGVASSVLCWYLAHRCQAGS
jgi:DHA1 family bicyclomycin/chloramphenicol resistance-like MFS transporter